MRESAVVLVRLPQADGAVKTRPALVLRAMPGHGDWLVCGISTQLAQRIHGFDELLDIHDPDYETSGVVQPSLIRLGFLAIVPPRRVLGCIGSVSTDRHKRLLHNLASHLVASRPAASG
jgi:mRNA interferase MazF